MSTTRTWRTTSANDTEQLGEQIGKLLRGGELVELASDLGGGKTTMTHGLVRGIGSSDPVASPTFTISREYTGGRLHVYHYDLYRLHEMGVVGETLSEVLGEPGAVVIVEWGGVAEDILPEKRVVVTIKPREDGGRDITVTAPDELAYVVPAEDRA